jgi:metallophosphoesterase (TIGR00282 family)
VDAFTSGNHIWDKKEINACLQQFPQLLRPANYPEGSPGRGHAVFTSASGVPVGVVSLQGRAFMPPLDCPFRTGQRAVRELKGLGARVILMDVHAEATAEKVALAAYLDGEASVVAGTHTHVPTADARISAKGTAAITDLGMTGGHDGIIGMHKDNILKKFLLHIPIKYEVAQGNVQLWGALIQVDEATGQAQSITQVHQSLS